MYGDECHSSSLNVTRTIQPDQALPPQIGHVQHQAIHLHPTYASRASEIPPAQGKRDIAVNVQDWLSRHAVTEICLRNITT
jgi:hypothetical protein